MRRHTLYPRAPRSGFTLVEILVVMAILLVLMASSIKIVGGVRGHTMRVKTEGHLNLLSNALNSYKADMGDYPWVEEGSEEVGLYRSLIGNRRPQGAHSIVLQAGKTALTNSPDPLATKAGSSYVDLANVVIGDVAKSSDENDQGEAPQPSLPASRDTIMSHVFIDTWGTPFVYRYKRISDAGKGWKAPRYLLFSRGANGADASKPDKKGVPAEGILDTAWMESEEAADNIYAP